MASIFQAADGMPPALRWYAVADAAQRSELPRVIAAAAESHCLFDAPDGSPLAATAPHLAALGRPSPDDKAWTWIERHGSSAPCVTVIASTLSFAQMLIHLRGFTEVLLPDGEEMFFAFWDPVILGTLVGQASDRTLHVPGPIFSVEQRDAFMQGIFAWWYWDRGGALQRIEGSALSESQRKEHQPLQLTQSQVDQLVEASVPDHLLHYVALNQPHLLDSIPRTQQYEFVCSSLQHARELGLEGMNDLVNFVCASLIYGDSMRADPTISALLEKVRGGELGWNEAMEALP